MRFLAAGAVTAETDARRFGHHQNGFGALRLIFASLVIVSHTPEIIDGDRRNEILTNVFGTISFGELAVFGFFIVSGYLITSSYLRSKSPLDYLLKRIARIYPGFVIAFLICWFIVAPLAGTPPFRTGYEVVKRLVECVALQNPEVPKVFPGTHYAALNGAMWSISYEFRCYLLILVLGMTGLLRRPQLVLALAVGTLLVACLFPPTGQPQDWYFRYTVGEWRGGFRLTSLFLFGSVFYLYRAHIHFNTVGIVLAAAGIVAGLLVSHLVPAAIAVCGGYLIFATARKSAGTLFSRINNENDISYGVYLYAWPVTKLLLWWWPSSDAWATGAATFAVAYACGWASWLLIEKPAMLWARQRDRMMPA